MQYDMLHAYDLLAINLLSYADFYYQFNFIANLDYINLYLTIQICTLVHVHKPFRIVNYRPCGLLLKEIIKLNTLHTCQISFYTIQIRRLKIS